MSSFSGLSAVLTVSLIAVITMQLLKDNLESYEYYNTNDEDGQALNSSDYFTEPYIYPGTNNSSSLLTTYEMDKMNLQKSLKIANNLNTITVNTIPNNYGHYNNSGSSQHNPVNTNMNESRGLASSLLPKPLDNKVHNGFNDIGSNFKQALANQVFLTPSELIGINPTQSSNRNQNQSLRSEPPNPIMNVGPWNNSTIGPDLLRLPLEGCGPNR